MSVPAQNNILQETLFAHGGRSEIVVGKDILELLSSSMYINPLTVYREYVQNSVDAIDAAVEAGLLSAKEDGRIDVMLDHINRRAIVRDNGIGLAGGDFAARLTSFGASVKRGTPARGFRGVGRLAGIGYCQELVFRSKTEQDKDVSVLKWSGRKLKQLLLDSEYKGDLSDIVNEVVSISNEEQGERPDRFFEVEVIKPKRLGKDLLVNEIAIANYLSQIAPCPFNPEFDLADEIRAALSSSGVDATGYNIFLNESEEPIYRPYANAITYSENQSGTLCEIRPIEIFDQEGETAAVGWIAHHDYQGAIPVDAKVRGLRARVGNIQIGNDRIFSEVFPEERFCSWTVGELHILDARVMPNGRRDEFEQNTHLTNIITHLVPFGHEVARHCRSSSQLRNRIKSFDLAEQKVFERVEIIQQAAIPKSSATALKREIGSQLSEMRQIASFSLFSGKEQKALARRLSKIELEVDGLTDQQTSADNPIGSLPKAKQTAYKEVFALIYECAQNKIVAKSMIDKIMDRISKS